MPALLSCWNDVSCWNDGTCTVAGSTGRSLACWCVLIAAVIVPASVKTVSADEPNRPNIVLLMADDQGYGDVGYMGHPQLQTPVLDEMAASALRFDHFYAAHPVCSPTRGSVMTGRHPNRFACFSWGHSLRPEEITIAEALKTAGYATGHFGKWHIGSCRADDDVCPGASGFDRWVSSPNFYENSPLLADNGRVIETEGESSEVTVRKALDFIEEQAKADKPFLSVVWYGNPHGPHIAVDELRSLYPDQPEKLQNYYGEISGIDRSVGLLREELRRLGIAENTIVWYTSDNGAQGPGSTAGLRGKKGTLWEGGVRVPAIIEWPARIKQPRVTNCPATTSDIYPTLLAITGVTMPNQPPLDGINLLPVIDGEQETRDKPLGFWVHPTKGIRTPSAEWLREQMQEQAGEREAQPAAQRTAASRMEDKFPTDEFPGHSAWRSGSWKLHRIPQKDGSIAFELYNLKRDPAEVHDRSKERPDRVETLGIQLEKWLSSVVASLNGDDY